MYTVFSLLRTPLAKQGFLSRTQLLCFFVVKANSNARFGRSWWSTGVRWLSTAGIGEPNVMRQFLSFSSYALWERRRAQFSVCRILWCPIGPQPSSSHHVATVCCAQATTVPLHHTTLSPAFPVVQRWRSRRWRGLLKTDDSVRWDGVGIEGLQRDRSVCATAHLTTVAEPAKSLSLSVAIAQESRGRHVA